MSSDLISGELSAHPQAPSEQSTRVEWATVPRVELLPPEISQARRFARVQRYLAGAVAATLLVTGAGVAWSFAEVGSANDALAATKATTTALRAKQATYADVPRVLAEVEAVKAAREQALGQDVDWAPFLTGLAGRIPASVWLTNLQVQVTGGTATPGGDPLAPAGIGDLTVAGGAKAFPDVSAWLQGAVAVPGLDGSTLQTLTRQTASNGGTAVQFSSRVRITPDALTHRYDRKAS